MGITIRNLRAADLDAADRIYRAAFGRDDSRKPEIAFYLTLQSGGWLLASLDGEPAGFVGAINYGPFAYVGMMCVCPETQRRGIGRALMERLLTWLDKRNCPLVMLDATAAGAPLYLKLGFEETGEMYTCRWHGQIRPGDVSAGIQDLLPEHLSELAAFDTPIFGANRSAVFAEYVRRFPHRGFIVWDKAGQVSGYIFGQARRIGPWVARRPEDAEALLGKALSLDYEHSPIMAVPAANPAVNDILRCHDFTMDGPWLHMQRGQPTSPIRYEQIYALASYTLG